MTTIPGNPGSVRGAYVAGVGIGDLIMCWFLLTITSISDIRFIIEIENLGRGQDNPGPDVTAPTTGSPSH